MSGEEINQTSVLFVPAAIDSSLANLLATVGPASIEPLPVPGGQVLFVGLVLTIGNYDPHTRILTIPSSEAEGPPTTAVLLAIKAPEPSIALKILQLPNVKKVSP